MKTFQKHAKSDEQQILANALPRHVLRPRQKIFWTIQTDLVTYQLICIGRCPSGLDVQEHALQLAVMPLDSNDEYFIEKHERTSGKYRVVTKSFSRNSTKFNAVTVHWDNMPDWCHQSYGCAANMIAIYKKYFCAFILKAVSILTTLPLQFKQQAKNALTYPPTKQSSQPLFACISNSNSCKYHCQCHLYSLVLYFYKQQNFLINLSKCTSFTCHTISSN